MKNPGRVLKGFCKGSERLESRGSGLVIVGFQEKGPRVVRKVSRGIPFRL